MVHEDSHSALRASADRISRRADAVGMAWLPACKAFGGLKAFSGLIIANVTAAAST
jgi:hypothetical protein